MTTPDSASADATIGHPSRRHMTRTSLSCHLAVLLYLQQASSAPTPIDADDKQCCAVCHAPRSKYYSIDGAHNLCGESCILPALYPAFKVFEKNLTAAASRDDPACGGLGYKQYNGTVTHGVPGLLSIKLDLYAPSEQL